MADLACIAIGCLMIWNTVRRRQRAPVALPLLLSSAPPSASSSSPCSLNSPVAPSRWAPKTLSLFLPRSTNLSPRATTSPASASASQTFRRRRIVQEAGPRGDPARQAWPATPSAGIPELRNAVATYMGDMRGLEISPDDIVVGSGAKPFIAYTILSTTDYGAGDEVIYPVPGVSHHESQITISGAVPVPLYLRESRSFAFDPNELESKITPRPSS